MTASVLPFPCFNVSFSFRVFGFLLLLLLSRFSQAIEVESLGDVFVPVKDESNEERWRGSYEGLAEVLVRIMGNDEYLHTEAAENILKDNSRYLLRFGYESMEGNALENYYAEDFPAITSSENSAAASKNLKVLGLKFDYHLLIQDMQKGGLPVWDVNRPELMFWWVSEERGVRNILSSSESNQSRDAILHYAQHYGLPVKFPLMDIEDRKQVQMSDLWGMYGEQIAKANKRYGNNIWVAGKNYFADNKWQAEWSVMLMGRRKSYRTSSDSLIRLQKTVIKHIAGKLAGEYAVLASDEKHKLILQVNDVRKLDSFSSLQNYLKGLFVVQQLSLLSIKGDEVRFEVSLKESSEKFQKLLKLDSKLIEVKDTDIPDALQSPSMEENVEDADTQNEALVSPDSALEQTEVKVPEKEYPVVHYRWADIK